LVLEPLVALNPSIVFVLRLAFLPRELDAVDPAVPFVEHVKIIDETSERAGAAGGIGADAVARHRDELLVLAERRRGQNEAENQTGQPDAHRKARDPNSVPHCETLL